MFFARRAISLGQIHTRIENEKRKRGEKGDRIDEGGKGERGKEKEKEKARE